MRFTEIPYKILKDFFSSTQSLVYTEPSTIITYTLSVSANAGGSVTPSGSIIVNSGNTLYFTIIPASGYSISDILLDDVSQGTTSPFELANITSNHTIYVNFFFNPVTDFTIISSVSDGSGTVTPLGTATYAPGSSQTFSFIPSGTSRINEVTVDGEVI